LSGGADVLGLASNPIEGASLADLSDLFTQGNISGAEKSAFDRGFSIGDVSKHVQSLLDGVQAPPSYEEYPSIDPLHASLYSGYSNLLGQHDTENPQRPSADAIRELLKQREEGYARTAYEDAILKANAWGDKQRKYATRHADYLTNAAKNIGSPFTRVDSPTNYASHAYVTTDASGKRHIIDAPHSPGGMYFDIDLGAGAKPLGLGDLGGWGQYKGLPQGAGASHIELDKYVGKAPTTFKADGINVKPKGGFLGGLGQFAPMALMLIPGFQALAPWMQGAIMGGAGSAISGGNPLKGAVLGGLGGYAGGAIGASEFAKGLNPALAKALSGGVRGLISSGGDFDAGLASALTGGIGASIAPHLGDYKWAASPLASVASSLIRGKPVTPQSITMNTLNALASSNAPRRAMIKGVK
jgi:hypothetical protein